MNKNFLKHNANHSPSVRNLRSRKIYSSSSSSSNSSIKIKCKATTSVSVNGDNIDVNAESFVSKDNICINSQTNCSIPLDHEDIVNINAESIANNTSMMTASSAIDIDCIVI